MTLSQERFAEYFAAVHGKGDITPYGWQRRLLEQLVTGGRWPEVIAAPTSAGKTSVIDIHVFAIALMAATAAPRLPRRLSLVVDRRVLVDDQYQHACELQDKLREAEKAAKKSPGQGGILAEVAALLRTLMVTPNGTSPLLVTRLRGGVPAPWAWRDDATACQIICATPDMWGSRLLLAGYGSSSLSRPREAGLLAFDSVVVVDEAHLSRQLIRTARRVVELAEIADHPLPVPVLQVVEATATPNRPESVSRVDVTEADLADSPQLEQRLCRAKPVELLNLQTWPIPAKGAARAKALATMAERAVELRERYGPTIGCFVNNVTTATDLAAHLSKAGRIRLVCGRLRPYDLDRLRDSKLLTQDGDPDVDYLITTQSLEVGVDLDWAAALVELAPGSAVAQRAGRVNRCGKRADTRIVVAGPANELSDKANVAPYEYDDLKAALAWLRERAGDPRGLAPWVLREHPPPGQSRRRSLLQRPELSDAWLWSRTSDRLFATADLDLWLSDTLDDDLDVGIVVRQDLPDDPAAATALIRALPPMDYEAMPVGIKTARERLANVDTPMILVRDDDVWTYTPHDSKQAQPEPRPRNGDRNLRPGDIVVVGTSAPIFTVIDSMPLVDSTGTDVADDVLEGPATAKAGQYVFRLGRGSCFDPATAAKDETTSAIRQVLAAAISDDRHHLNSRTGRQRLAEALGKLVPTVDEEHLINRVREAIAMLGGRIKDFDVATFADADGLPSRLLITDNRRLRHDEATRQQWTPGERVTLHAHAMAVACRARDIADKLGLEQFADLLELAGRYHDDGKAADRRFQISLDPEQTSTEPLAKSGMTTKREIDRARAMSGLPSYWRHEQLSILACWDALADHPCHQRDLIARLVGTSHGYGRPSFPHAAAELTSDPEVAGLARLLFDEGEWDHLIERTHTAYGIWGCAYLEALLRAADGQVSGEGS